MMISNMSGQSGRRKIGVKNPSRMLRRKTKGRKIAEN